ncbi:MAG: branched-chain amino acid ABC transporter permease, partial [Bacillota bacterium]
MQLLAQATMTGILNAGIYALIASGLTLIFGVINVVNFAHGAFLMLAMYQSYWLYELWRISPYWSLFINIPVFFCIGYVIQKSLVRRVLDSPNYVQLLLTLGIMMVMENVAMLAWGSNPRVVQAQMPSTVSIAGGVVLSLPRLIAFLVAAGMTAGLHFFLARTNTGRAIRAAAQDREKAAMLGIDVRR